MPDVRKLLLYPLTALALLGGLSACTESEEDDGDDGNPSYTIPSDYSTFENVDFSGQTARLDMLGELGAYLKSAHSPGIRLDSVKLRAMFANESNPFSKEGLNASGKKLKDKTFAPHLGYFDSLLVGAAVASQDTAPARKGKAGLVTAANGATRYLVDERGREYAQLVEKGLMGAVAYYQATSVYLDTATKLSAALTDSAREHHWDEAYGYFTSSTRFPAEGKDRFWSKYSNDKSDKSFGTNAKLQRAFAKGRAAITAKHREGMLEAIDSVRREWELVCAASAVSYLNAAKRGFTDDAVRSHALSEALAFVKALRYNPDRRITVEQIAEIETKLGDFWDATPAAIDAAIEVLDGVFGFGDAKPTL